MFFVGNELKFDNLFWGKDRLEFVEDMLVSGDIRFKGVDHMRALL